MAVAGRPTGLISLARALSKFGVCSRKQAEERIAEGRVTVNGRPELDPRTFIDPLRDRLLVDGKVASDDVERIVLALHKPVGYITSRTDPAGRPTVYDLLGAHAQWVFPVGRLDRDTSGLLILTNDHKLGERLTNPGAHLEKTYHVHVRGLVAPEELEVLREGVEIGDPSPTRPARVRLVGTRRDGGTWLEIVLTEGRNRQVRRMCAAVGHDVIALARVRIGSYALGSLAPGAFVRLEPGETRMLLRPPPG